MSGRGRATIVVDNTLDREFDVAAPDTTWVSDITDIRTNVGFLYLAVVIDLFSLRAIGWAEKSRQPADLGRTLCGWPFGGANHSDPS